MANNSELSSESEQIDPARFKFRGLGEPVEESRSEAFCKVQLKSILTGFVRFYLVRSGLRRYRTVSDGSGGQERVEEGLRWLKEFSRVI